MAYTTRQGTAPSSYELLEYPNHREMEHKAALVRKIHDAIDSHGLTQAQAAGIAGIEEEELSRLLRGIFRRVSEDRIQAVLGALGASLTP